MEHRWVGGWVGGRRTYHSLRSTRHLPSSRRWLADMIEESPKTEAWAGWEGKKEEEGRGGWVVERRISLIVLLLRLGPVGSGWVGGWVGGRRKARR